MRTPRPKWGYLLIITVIIIVSRLPQLTSPNLFLDGDECIVGLMAKHVSEGKAMPVYFYGQTYEFALIEVLPAALSFKLYGVTDLPLRSAMLALWAIGAIFYYLALSNIIGEKKGFWFTLLLVFMPGWAAWSMKARGGYITAFTASSAIIYLISQGNRNIRRCFIIGILLAITFLSQPLWIAGLIPIVLFGLLRKAKISCWVSLAAGCLITAAAIKLAALGNTHDYWHPEIFFNHDFINNALNLPKKIFDHLAGIEPERVFIKPSRASLFVAAIWLALIILGIIKQAIRSSKHKSGPWQNMLFFSVILTVCYILPLAESSYGYRYLLPLSGFLIMWIGIVFSQWIDYSRQVKKICCALIAVLLLSGAYSLSGFKYYAYLPLPKGVDRSERQSMASLINYLKDNGVKHVFSADPLLQWQIMFYSKEGILSRWVEPVDRCPRYTKEVSAALKEGKTTALVEYFNAQGTENTIVINKRYSIYLNPEEKELELRGFKFQ